MKASLKLGAFLPYRINRLAERVSSSLADVYARRFQISVAQWRVLATLKEHPGMGVNAVARRTNMDKVKVSRAVSGLEERKYLRRKPSAEDGRALELRLSPQGRRLFHAIEPLALEWEGHLLDMLGSAEKARLLDLLNRLEEGMDAFDSLPSSFNPGVN
ncbi:MAG: MarR family winged helix-turn-helix transcriptional regulator [Congregibacter sp.]